MSTRTNLASLYDELARNDTLLTKKPCYENRCTHSFLLGEQITKPQPKQNKTNSLDVRFFNHRRLHLTNKKDKLIRRKPYKPDLHRQDTQGKHVPLPENFATIEKHECEPIKPLEQPHI